MYPQYHHQHHPHHPLHHQHTAPLPGYHSLHQHSYTHTAHAHAHTQGHLYSASHSVPGVGAGSPSVGGGVTSTNNTHFHGGTIDPLVAAWIWAEIHLSPFVFVSSSALQHVLDLQRPALVNLALTPGAYSGGPSFTFASAPATTTTTWTQPLSQQAYPGISSLSSSPSPCPPSSLSSSWTSSTASSSSISSRSPVLSTGSNSVAAAAQRTAPVFLAPANDHFSAYRSSSHAHAADLHHVHVPSQPHYAIQHDDAPRIDRSPTWRARAALYREFAQLYPEHFKSLVTPPATASHNPYAYGGGTTAYHDLDSYFAPRAYGSASSSSPLRYHSSTLLASASSTSPYLGHYSAHYACDPDAPDPLLTMVAARMIRSPVTALFPSEGWSPAYLSPYWSRSLRSCSGLITSVQKIALAKAVFDHEGDVCGVKLTVKGLVPDGAPGATELVATATVTTTCAAAAAATTPARGAMSTTSGAPGVVSAKATPKKHAQASACSSKQSKSPSSPKPSSDTPPSLPASALTPILTLCRILVGPGRYPVHTITDCFAFVLGVSLSSAWLALAPLPTLHQPITRPGQPKLSTLDLLVAKLGGSGGGPAMIGEWQCEISAASMGHSAFLKSCGGGGGGGGTGAPSLVSVRVLPGGTARLRGKWNARPVPPPTGEYLYDDIPGIQEYMRWVANLVAEDPVDLVECTRASLPVNALADHPDKDALAVVEHAIRGMAVAPQLIAPADSPAPHAQLLGLDCFSIWKRNAAWAPVKMRTITPDMAQDAEKHGAVVRDMSPFKKKKRADSAVSMGGGNGRNCRGRAADLDATVSQAPRLAGDEAFAEEASADQPKGTVTARGLPKLGTKDAGAALPGKKPPTVSPV